MKRIMVRKARPTPYVIGRYQFGITTLSDSAYKPLQSKKSRMMK